MRLPTLQGCVGEYRPNGSWRMEHGSRLQSFLGRPPLQGSLQQSRHRDPLCAETALLHSLYYLLLRVDGDFPSGTVGVVATSVPNRDSACRKGTSSFAKICPIAVRIPSALSLSLGSERPCPLLDPVVPREI